VLYPELRKFDAQDQAGALAKAKAARLDAIELVGVAVGLLVTVLITRYSSDGLSVSGRFAAILANFVIAVPFLGILVGPFLVRRTRRSLRAQCALQTSELTRGGTADGTSYLCYIRRCH
jgi:hypothetical protein